MQQAEALRSKNLIPEPPGQAGRRSEYIIFKGLGVSKETYRALRVRITLYAHILTQGYFRLSSESMRESF
jgi:hypothetical protein